jgi:hypothetical protein
LDRISKKIKSVIMRESFIVLMIALLLCAVIGHRVIVSSGIVILAENFEVYSIDALEENYNPYWQEKFQYFDFGIADSVYLYGLFILIGKLMRISYEIIQRIMLLLPHSLAFISMYCLTRRMLLRSAIESPKRLVIIISIIAGTAYTLNPWIAVQPRDIMLRFDYALTPLVLLLFFNVLEYEKNRFTHIFVLSVVVSIIACLRYLMVMTPALILLVLMPTRPTEERSSLPRRLSIAFFVFVCISLLAAGKFLSPILYSLQSRSIPYAEAFHEGMISRAPLVEILSTKVMGSQARSALDDTYSDSSDKLFIIVSLFSFLYLSLKKRRFTGYELYFPILVLITIPLAALKQYPFEGISVWFLTRAPLSNLYGRLLRYSDWNSLPVLVSIPVMVGMTLSELYRRLPRRILVFVFATVSISIVLLCAVSSWPLLTGDLNGYWRASKVPEEYIRLNDIFRDSREDFHVLWTPSYWENKALWANNSGLYYCSAPTCNFDIRSSAKPSYLTEHFYLFDYYNVLGLRPGFRPLDGYSGKNLSRIYEDLNIRYVVIHNDVGWGELSMRLGFDDTKISGVIDSIKKDSVMKHVSDMEILSIFKTADRTSEFKITTPLCVLGGLPAHGAIIDAGIELRNSSLVYLDNAHFGWDAFERLLNVSRALVIKGKTNIALSLIPSAFDNRSIMAPYEYTYKRDHKKSWSRAHINAGIADPYFQQALSTFHLPLWSWEFGYGDNLAFTSAPGADLTMPYDIEEEGDYVLLVRFFANRNGGALSCSVDRRDIRFATYSDRNHFELTMLSRFYLSKGKHTVTLRNVEGFNAVNFICLVRGGELERRKAEIETLIYSKPCVQIHEAETDCIGNNEFQVERNGEASNGLTVRLEEGDTLKCIMEIFKEDDYRLHVGLKGGVQAFIGEQRIDILADELGKKSSPILKMNEGMHELEITPLVSPSYLDVVWFGSDEFGDGIEDWIEVEENTAEIIHQSKKDVSRSALIIEADSPFLLTMAEGFDPLAAARVKNEKISSIPVFGTINGFLVDRTGDNSVEIVFPPQIWAKNGLWISLISLLLMAVYIVGGSLFGYRND